MGIKSCYFVLLCFVFKVENSRKSHHQHNCISLCIRMKVGTNGIKSLFSIFFKLDFITLRMDVFNLSDDDQTVRTIY